MRMGNSSTGPEVLTARWASHWPLATAHRPGGERKLYDFAGTGRCFKLSELLESVSSYSRLFARRSIVAQIVGAAVLASASTSTARPRDSEGPSGPSSGAITCCFPNEFHRRA